MIDNGWDPEDNGPTLRFVGILAVLFLLSCGVGIGARIHGFGIWSLLVTTATFSVLCLVWAGLQVWRDNRP